MEELAPDVLVLRDWCMLKPFSTPEAGDGAEGETPTHELRNANLFGRWAVDLRTDAAAEEAVRSGMSSAAVRLPMADPRTALLSGAGTGSDSQCGEWKQSFVIELTEPGRPAPQQDVSSYHQVLPHVALGDNPSLIAFDAGSDTLAWNFKVVGGGSTDLGLDAAGLGTVGCYGPRASGGGQRHRSNASKRRAAAFRRRLVLAAVAALRRQGHEDQLKGMLAENAETGKPPRRLPCYDNIRVSPETIMRLC